MPSGKAHALATCITAGAVAPLLYVAGQPLPTALAFAGGCLAGLVVTPDLDVRGWDTHSETIVRRSGGCLIGAIWNLLWLPYAYLIPRHRHPLSHWPVLGTLLRFMYLLAIPALAWWVLGLLGWVSQLQPSFVWGLISDQPLLIVALGGLALVDALHWAMDAVF